MSEITYAFPKLKNVDPSCYIDAYNLILECSQANSPRSFAIRLLEKMDRVCSYDQAVVLFLDVNGKVSGHYTVNIDKKWLDMYLNYFLKDSDFPQEVNIYQDLNERSDFQFSRQIDWSRFPRCDFITNYIEARELKYSWGFAFFDLNGAYRVVFSLDRIRDVPFSEIEKNRLNLALPILNNMHRSFFYQGMDSDGTFLQSRWKEYNLTKREIEITNLLCQGMTVQNISSVLYIALTTTYKHIANIYKKLGVSSQQELLVKMLNRKAL